METVGRVMATRVRHLISAFHISFITPALSLMLAALPVMEPINLLSYFLYTHHVEVRWEEGDEILASLTESLHQFPSNLFVVLLTKSSFAVQNGNFSGC